MNSLESLIKRIDPLIYGGTLDPERKKFHANLSDNNFKFDLYLTDIGSINVYMYEEDGKSIPHKTAYGIQENDAFMLISETSRSKTANAIKDIFYLIERFFPGYEYFYFDASTIATEAVRMKLSSDFTMHIIVTSDNRYCVYLTKGSKYEEFIPGEIVYTQEKILLHYELSNALNDIKRIYL